MTSTGQSLIDQVFGQRRPKSTPQWDNAVSFAKNDALFAAYDRTVGRARTTRRAEERLLEQRRMYEQILSNPTHLSVEEVKHRALVAAAAAAHREEEDEDLEVVFERACRRMFLLWDQVRVEEDVRQHFKATVLSAPPTVESLRIIHDEVARLAGARAAEKRLASAIESRESFVYLLQEAVEKVASGASKKDVNIKVSSVINSIRVQSFEVVESVAEWRQQLGYDAIYLWRGTSYLLKMATDLSFMASSPLLPRVGCAVMGNPMLNPARQADSEQMNIKAVAGSFASSTAPSGPGTRPGSAGDDGKPTLPPLRYRGAQRSPFGYVPAKKNPDAPSSLLYTPERYEDAELVVKREPELYRQFMANQKVFRFEDESIEAQAEPDHFITRTLEDIRFVPENLEEVIEEQEKQASDARHEREAAITIQRLVRGFLGRKTARHRRAQHEAAKTIQALYRHRAGRRRAGKIKQRKQAACKLQALAKGGAIRTRDKERAIENEAAARIQALCRGHLTRRNYKMWKSVWFAATQIQRVYRGWKSRTATAATKSRVYNGAASNIQKIWKGLRLRELGVADPKRLKAATDIQRVFRGNLARQYYSAMVDINSKAAKITAVMKGHVLRTQNPSVVSLRRRKKQEDEDSEEGF